MLFIHIVNSKTAPVFHKTFDWGTGEFENENGEKWSSPYGIGIIYNTSDEKMNGKIFLFRLVHRQ